jgi:hypothetical protein
VMTAADTGGMRVSTALGLLDEAELSLGDLDTQRHFRQGLQRDGTSGRGRQCRLMTR